VIRVGQSDPLQDFPYPVDAKRDEDKDPVPIINQLLAGSLVGALMVLMIPSASFPAQNCTANKVAADRLYQIAGILYDVDPALLKAIAQVESCQDPSVTSPKGAQGLMQLMPATALEFGVRDPFDPVDNLLGAARFLRKLRTSPLAPKQNLVADLPTIIAAYSAGPGAVSKYGTIPPYPETRNYVRKVLLAYLVNDRILADAPIGRAICRSTLQTSSDFHWLEQLQQIRDRRDHPTAPSKNVLPPLLNDSR
jgi:soluble lytic murein transglycosylase-like protein